jgi:hypothetical protein
LRWLIRRDAANGLMRVCRLRQPAADEHPYESVATYADPDAAREALKTLSGMAAIRAALKAMGAEQD